MRFTSANEHGDANVDSVNYSDRQHSTRDILGVDTDNDQVVDSFYVDFNYLSRNAVINGIGATMAAIGPPVPTLVVDTARGNRIRVEIQNEFFFSQYRIAVRSVTNDWDSVYTLIGKMVDTISLCDTGTYYVSAATMNYKNVEGLFTGEIMVQLRDSSMCVYNGLNDELTAIPVFVHGNMQTNKAFISICDLSVKEVQRTPVSLNKGMNEVFFRHGYHASGIFFYTLVIDDKPVQTRRMVFGN